MNYYIATAAAALSQYDRRQQKKKKRIIGVSFGMDVPKMILHAKNLSHTGRDRIFHMWVSSSPVISCECEKWHLFVEISDYAPVIHTIWTRTKRHCDSSPILQNSTSQRTHMDDLSTYRVLACVRTVFRHKMLAKHLKKKKIVVVADAAVHLMLSSQ